MNAGKIWANQRKEKARLLKLRDELFGVLYIGGIRKQSVNEIHQSLLNATINSQPLEQEEIKELKNKSKKQKLTRSELEGFDLLILAMALTKKVVKKSSVGISPFKTIYKNFERSEKIINSSLRENEVKDKEQYLKELQDSDTDIFYVASSHGDSAKDHAQWQGKIYVDANWRSKVKDENVRKFIENGHFDTMQWVTGSPVYFLTRPNCRHYFVRYTAEAIMSGNYTIPFQQVGSRGNQTRRGRAVKFYENRKKMLNVLYEKYKTDDLRNQITKTNIIIENYKKGI